MQKNIDNLDLIVIKSGQEGGEPIKERIKAIRRGLGLNQTEFGQRLGLSQNFICMLEKGQREAGERTIRDICREFRVSPEWLKTGAGDMFMAAGREEELGALVASLMSERPESFRRALVTVLLKFDPDGPEWAALERIFDSVKKEDPDR